MDVASYCNPIHLTFSFHSRSHSAVFYPLLIPGYEGYAYISLSHTHPFTYHTSHVWSSLISCSDWWQCSLQSLFFHHLHIRTYLQRTSVNKPTHTIFLSMQTGCLVAKQPVFCSGPLAYASVWTVSNWYIKTCIIRITNAAVFSYRMLSSCPLRLYATGQRTGL